MQSWTRIPRRSSAYPGQWMRMDTTSRYDPRHVRVNHWCMGAHRGQTSGGMEQEWQGSVSEEGRLNFLQCLGSYRRFLLLVVLPDCA